MFTKSIKLSIITSILFASNIYSADGFDDEFADDSGGFGNDEVIEIVKLEKEDTKKFIINGAISFSTSYNYAHNNASVVNDFRDLSSAKLSSDLNLEYKLNNGYKIKSTLKAYKDLIYNIKDDKYQVVPKDYDSDIDINELYIQGSLNNQIDIKIGRQVVVWGKSDNIRITDSLNSLDNTTPGMVDIEDLRLGTTMSKMDYFIDRWSVSGIILHENRFSKLPKYGSDYASLNQTNANNAIIEEPSNSIQNSGIALNINGNLEGEDIAFYYSNKYIDNTIYRSNMLGMAYNNVISSFLLKTEVAYFDNYDSNTVDSKIDGLVGLEYSGISDGSISLEIANKTDDIQYALRFTQSFINQTLDFTALYNGFGKDLNDGGFIRTWFDYDIDDSLSSSFGIINYLGGDVARFEMIKENDRVFASLKYSF